MAVRPRVKGRRVIIAPERVPERVRGFFGSHSHILQVSGRRLVKDVEHHRVNGKLTSSTP